MNLALILTLIVALPPGTSATGRGASPSSRTANRALRAGPTVEIDGERIRLGDLTATAPLELADLDIGPSPAPGHPMVLRREALQEALRRAGADPRLADGLPAAHVIVRRTQVLTSADLDARIRELVGPSLPVGVKIRAVSGLRDLAFAPGPERTEVRIGPLRRSTSAVVTVYVHDRIAKQLTVSLQLDGQALVPHAALDIPTGSTISAQDVRLAPSDLDAIPPSAATRLEQVVGHETRQVAKGGRPLSRHAVRTPALIARGAQVTLVAVGSGLRITRRVIAQEDGEMGGYIQVLPTDAAEGPLRARVIAANEVRIQLGPTP